MKVIAQYIFSNAHNKQLKNVPEKLVKRFFLLKFVKKKHFY